MPTKFTDQQSGIAFGSRTAADLDDGSRRTSDPVEDLKKTAIFAILGMTAGLKLMQGKGFGSPLI